MIQVCDCNILIVLVELNTLIYVRPLNDSGIRALCMHYIKNSKRTVYNQKFSKVNAENITVPLWHPPHGSLTSKFSSSMFCAKRPQLSKKWRINPGSRCVAIWAPCIICPKRKQLIFFVEAPSFQFRKCLYLENRLSKGSDTYGKVLLNGSYISSFLEIVSQKLVQNLSFLSTSAIKHFLTCLVPTLDKEGRNVLFYAAMGGNKNSFEILRQVDPDEMTSLSRPSKDGKTLLHIGMVNDLLTSYLELRIHMVICCGHLLSKGLACLPLIRSSTAVCFVHLNLSKTWILRPLTHINKEFISGSWNWCAFWKSVFAFLHLMRIRIIENYHSNGSNSCWDGHGFHFCALFGEVLPTKFAIKIFFTA